MSTTPEREALDRIAAVRRLHRQDEDEPIWCAEDGWGWPCATITALTSDHPSLLSSGEAAPKAATPTEDEFGPWRDEQMKDPEFKAAYDALDVGEAAPREDTDQLQSFAKLRQDWELVCRALAEARAALADRTAEVERLQANEKEQMTALIKIAWTAAALKERLAAIEALCDEYDEAGLFPHGIGHIRRAALATSRSAENLNPDAATQVDAAQPETPGAGEDSERDE